MLFADDTVLYHSDPNLPVLYNEMQQSVEKMYKWCKYNQITLNIKKCEYIHFRYRKNVNHINVLKLGDVVLNGMKKYKYLGTVMDEKLSGEAHYNHILQVLSLRKQTFSKIRF